MESSERVLLFGARWCPVIAPLRRALDKVCVIEYVDIDDAPTDADRHQVATIPAVVVLDAAGNEHGRLTGLFGANDLRRLLASGGTA